MHRERLPLSCDNVVARRDAAAGDRPLVGKNSDRPATECQPLVYTPAADHDSDATLELAYRELPQPERTYATLGAAPYWCWGYEMGVNEHDVIVGNEAVFTRPLAIALEHLDDGDPPDRGILGMEYVRLALERARTAADAVEVVGGLLEEYGQFGSAVRGDDDADGAYDNSYLISDPEESWVVETAGRRWVARRVVSGTATISNELTTRRRWDRGSADVVAHAREQGWWPGDSSDPVDFAFAYEDHEVSRQVSHVRRQRTRSMLRAAASDGGVDLDAMRNVLRDHYEDTFLDGPSFNAALPDFHTVCMHDSPAGFTWGNTVSSAIFELPAPSDGFTTLWWTPGPPCIGVYVPFYVLAGDPPASVSRAGTAGRERRAPATAPADDHDPDSYWWTFERLLTAAKGDDFGSEFAANQSVVRSVFDDLEERFVARAPAVEDKARHHLDGGDRVAARETLASFTDDCVAEVRDAAARLERMLAV